MCTSLCGHFLIGEILSLSAEDGNENDPYAVAGVLILEYFVQQEKMVYSLYTVIFLFRMLVLIKMETSRLR